ncbi:hypothetical protein J6590_049082 [Homalodisca vitripennis]|nr:hypothetical protein J6590_049082 [Homalodisca vitripennis]
MAEAVKKLRNQPATSEPNEMMNQICVVRHKREREGEGEGNRRQGQRPMVGGVARQQHTDFRDRGGTSDRPGSRHWSTPHSTCP